MEIYARLRPSSCLSFAYVSCSEILYEDEEFSQRHLAALVASKVYYHLGAFEDSLAFALGAGNLFDASSKSEYVETIIGKLSVCFYLVKS